MTCLSKSDEERIGTNIAITHNTVLQLLQTIQMKSDEGAQGRRDKTMLSFLGCIAMAMVAQAEIALATAERSSIVIPS